MLLILILLAWNTWVVYPLKLLVVFFHELSHALMAYATGGAVEEIQLSAAEGGLCITRGGNVFLILFAGYLGSLAWGAAILEMARRPRGAKAAMTGLGLLVLFVGIVFVRPLIGFGIVFAGVAGAAMVVMGLRAAPHVNAIVLRMIGLTSCMYVVLDIKSDTIDRSHVPSDARMLAEMTGVPTVIWGGLWLVVALAAVALMFRTSLRRTLRSGVS